MDGKSVFSFFTKEVPQDVKSLVNFSSIDLPSVDYFIIHQTSKIVNDLINKLKLDSSKVPKNYFPFGNTSSVSVPLTMVTELKDKLVNRNKLTRIGFGVGFS